MGVTSAPLTVEQFLESPEDETVQCELVEGEVICMGRPGRRHERVKANCVRLLDRYLNDHPIGMVFPESMYKLGPGEARIPDVSLELNEKIPAKADDQLPEGAPDLAVEVVSSESAAFLERKIHVYLNTGSRMVWVAYPEERRLWVYRSGGETKILYENDYLEEPALLPGFRVQVSRFFEGT